MVCLATLCSGLLTHVSEVIRRKIQERHEAVDKSIFSADLVQVDILYLD